MATTTVYYFYDQFPSQSENGTTVNCMPYSIPPTDDVTKLKFFPVFRSTSVLRKFKQFDEVWQWKNSIIFILLAILFFRYEMLHNYFTQVSVPQSQTPKRLKSTHCATGLPGPTKLNRPNLASTVSKRPYPQKMKSHIKLHFVTEML